MSQSRPKLSIITPVKDAEAWLDDCVRSVCSQSFSEWEWVLVDDHSQDGSCQMLHAFAEKDDRLTIFRSPGRGILPALQKALTESSGSFITRMDADDMMPDDRLLKMVNALEDAAPKTVVTGLVRYFSDDLVSKGYRKYEMWLNEMALASGFWRKIYRECVVASPNWIMRRNELEEIGGFDGLVYPEDYDLVFRWYANGFCINTIPDVMLHWREHPGRTSRNSPHYQQKAFFDLKVRRFVELDLRSKSLCLWGTGIKAKRTAAVLDSLHIPFSLMQTQSGPKTIAGHEMLHYTEVEKLHRPQLLIAVYPPPKEMEELRAYLQKLQLTEGDDYWFL